MRLLGVVEAREVWLLAAPELGVVPGARALASEHFVVLFAIDARGVPDAEISSAAARLIECGAVRFECAGSDSNRVEALVVREALARHPASDGDRVIGTTSHQKRGFGDALRAVLWAQPAKAYAPTCRAVLAVVVASERWVAEVERAIAAFA